MSENVGAAVVRVAVPSGGIDPSPSHELLGDLRREVIGGWQGVRALRAQRVELASRELVALRAAREAERRVRELERGL